MRGNPGFAVLFERRIFQLQRTVKYDAQQLRTRTIDRLDEYALCFRDEFNLRSFCEVMFFSQFLGYGYFSSFVEINGVFCLYHVSQKRLRQIRNKRFLAEKTACKWWTRQRSRLEACAEKAGMKKIAQPQSVACLSKISETLVGLGLICGS